MQKPKEKDDSLVRELVPTKVRLVCQARRPQKGKDTSYSQLPGHALVAEVRNVREFRRLWRSIEQIVQKGGWRDAPRPAPSATQLPAAGVPAVGDRS